MCPHRRRHEDNMSGRRSQEAENPQGQPTTSGLRSRRLTDDAEMNTDDEAYRIEETTNLLLYTTVEAYRNALLIQHAEPTVGANHGMRNIYQVITVPPLQCNEISTNYMDSHRGYNVMYDRNTSSPNSEHMTVNISETVDDSDEMSTISLESEESSDDTDVLSSLNTTMSIISRDLSERSDYEDEITDITLMPNRGVNRHNAYRFNSSPAPKPTIARRRLRSDFKMPAATATAAQVANRLIKYAHCLNIKFENEICCPTCGLFPIWPVTGVCGHTRCLTCAEVISSCPCGEPAPESVHINIVIRDINKSTQEPKNSSMEVSTKTFFKHQEKMSVDDCGSPMSLLNVPTTSQLLQNHHCRTPHVDQLRNRRLPMSYQARYNQATELLMAGKYTAAVPHFAIAAASYAPEMRRTRYLLAQCITIMSKNRDPRSWTRQLYRQIRDLCSTSWILPSELECILCCDTFTNPVTTPCGHMFCRTCLERTMDYRKRCPLCLRTLETFNLAETGDTKLVEAALKSINFVTEPAPLEPDLIPIFVCTVAYPTVPCPLFIFDPRYWLMIRRVLESGSRKFGMVACDRGKSYVDYGTILEVRDCVHLEDGRSILSTVGLSRFKVIERGVRDGCEVARILPIVDVPVQGVTDIQLNIVANRVLLKALRWINTLNTQVKEDIEAAFGSFKRNFPYIVYSADGPSWLWWLVAVLPLRSEIKILILSTTCLLKRLLAVSRTLEAVDQVALTTASPSECELRNNYARRAAPMQINEGSEQDVS